MAFSTAVALGLVAGFVGWATGEGIADGALWGGPAFLATFDLMLRIAYRIRGR